MRYGTQPFMFPKMLKQDFQKLTSIVKIDKDTLLVGLYKGCLQLIEIETLKILLQTSIPTFSIFLYKTSADGEVAVCTEQGLLFIKIIKHTRKYFFKFESKKYFEDENISSIVEIKSNLFIVYRLNKCETIIKQYNIIICLSSNFRSQNSLDTALHLKCKFDY